MSMNLPKHTRFEGTLRCVSWIAKVEISDWECHIQPFTHPYETDTLSKSSLKVSIGFVRVDKYGAVKATG